MQDNSQAQDEYDASYCSISEQDEVKIDKCERYFSRLLDDYELVFTELKHYQDDFQDSDENTPKPDIQCSVETLPISLEEGEEVQRLGETDILHVEKNKSKVRLPRRRFRKMYHLRHEIELLTMQLELHTLDFEHIYRHLGFHLVDIFKRIPLLLKSCDCSSTKNCLMHKDIKGVVTSIYNPLAVFRVGCTFVVIDGIQKMFQICWGAGERFSLFRNQVASLCWFLFPLLNHNLLDFLPKTMVIPLGDGCVFSFDGRRGKFEFVLLDAEGHLVDFKTKEELRQLHECCIKFPILIKDQFDQKIKFMPCLLRHAPKPAEIVNCTSCSMNSF